MPTLQDIDWKNLEGKDWTTALRNQNPGHRTPEPTTCVAFGVLAVLETLLKIHYYNDPSQPLDLSEGNLWTCGHRWAAKNPEPTGECSTWRDNEDVNDTDTWQPLPAMKYLKKFGVASGDDPSGSGKCVCAAPSPNTKIKDFKMIPFTGTKDDPLPWMDDVRTHLVTIGPCIAEYDFLAPETGSHCIAIVGCNDAEQKFWIKDSLHKAGHNDTYLEYGKLVDLNVRPHFIWVFKPILKINIRGISEASELSLKIVKTGTTNPGNLTDVDPTVLPNLRSKYIVSEISASGWHTISPKSAAGTIALPLELAVPPGKYLINAMVSGRVYASDGEVEVQHTDGEDKVTEIEVREPFSTIQGAIDAAIAGDTIEVPSGTYKENVVVNKQLTLRGVDTNGGRPVIDAGGSGSAITITADGCIINGFKVKNSGSWPNAGIKVASNFNVVENNTVIDNRENGILLDNTTDNTISSNTATNNGGDGIQLISSCRNNIEGNIADSNGESGIVLVTSANNNRILGNIATGNKAGILLASSCKSNIISGNTAKNDNFAGIIIYSSSSNIISGNTFNQNSKNGIYLYTSSNNNIEDNDVNGNYNGINLAVAPCSGNIIFLNNFNNIINAWSNSPNNWHSPTEIEYNGNITYVGNHWSDYTGIPIPDPHPKT